MLNDDMGTSHDVPISRLDREKHRGSPASRDRICPYARNAGVKHQKTSYTAFMMVSATLATDTRRTCDCGI